MTRREPVGGPFPDVADHVEETVAVGRECPNRRRSRVAVRREVFQRECALPDVGHVTAVWCQLVAPCELGTIEATARRVLPLRRCWQLLACPGGIGRGILEGDVHHRMLVQALVRLATAAGPSPIRAELELPP